MLKPRALADQKVNEGKVNDTNANGPAMSDGVAKTSFEQLSSAANLVWHQILKAASEAGSELGNRRVERYTEVARSGVKRSGISVVICGDKSHPEY